MKGRLNECVEIILNTVKLGSVYDEGSEDAFWCVSRENDELSIQTVDEFLAYKEAITTLYNHFSVKDRSFSCDFFESLIHDSLFSHEKDIITFIKKGIEANPIREFVIIRPLYGGYLRNEVLSRAEYTFINKNYIDDYIMQYGEKELFRSFLGIERNIKFKSYIEIKFNARDTAFALEETAGKFRNLDNVLRAMTGGMDKHSGLGTFNFNTRMSGGYVCIDLVGQKLKMSPEYISQPVRGILLDEIIFPDKKDWREKLWRIIEASNPNWLQLRILKAINWIGRSINEEDDILAFLQGLFAMECLLQYQSGFVDKGLSANMSECFAFIVGDNLEARRNAEKRFKELYIYRSKLVHGTYTENIASEKNIAIEFALYIINNLLTKEEFFNITNEKEFRNTIETLRYR